MCERVGHVDFLAFGGSGMGSLAGLRHARGIAVTGSDANLYPPMSELLEQWEIPVNFIGTPTGGSCAPGCHDMKEYKNR